MDFKTVDKSEQTALVQLFTSVFTASEGKQEGKLIGSLSLELASTIDDEETVCFGAYDGDVLTGAIFFTQLQFSDPVRVYMLAPVAVCTEQQGKGIGQSLIRYGLDEITKWSVRVAVTYGDPSFYSKVGFRALSEDVIKAPLELSMPFGWLGQSLTEDPIPVIHERPMCVKPFRNPAYW